MYFNAYKFYYNSPALANGDSIFVTFIVTHLKAGNAQTMRYNQVKKFMERLEDMGRLRTTYFREISIVTVLRIVGLLTH